MRTPRLTNPTRRLVLGTLATTMLAAGCHVRETRVATPEADYAAELVRSRVETREGKKKPTWKPIVLGVIAAATAGSVAMVWGGFLAPNRPLAVTGIVGAVVIPTLGSLPFLLEQDQPWTKTEWEEWQPVPGSKAAVDVMGRQVEPLTSHALVADAEGNLQVPLSQLCDAPRMSELHLVDVVVRVPDADAEVASATLPVDRLPAPCGGGRLSLFGRAPAPAPAAVIVEPLGSSPSPNPEGGEHAQH